MGVAEIRHCFGGTEVESEPAEYNQRRITGAHSPGSEDRIAPARGSLTGAVSRSYGRQARRVGCDAESCNRSQSWPVWTPPPRNRPKPRWIPGSGAAYRPGSGPISRRAVEIFNKGEIYRVIDEAHFNAKNRCRRRPRRHEGPSRRPLGAGGGAVTDVTLLPDARARLDELERVIERGFKTFIETGTALAEI